MEDFLKTIKIKIFYDDELKKITKTNSEEAVISEGMTFAEQLYFIFSSYPEIPKKYPPGKLGFLLNNKLPNKFDILHDGDEITLIVA